MFYFSKRKRNQHACMCSCKVETDRTKMTRNSELNLFQVCTNIIECRSHVVCDAEIERHTVGSRDHARYHPSQGGASRAAHLLPVRRQLHLPRPHICMVYHLRIHVCQHLCVQHLIITRHHRPKPPLDAAASSPTTPKSLILAKNSLGMVGC